jgi:hypothetical protein
MIIEETVVIVTLSVLDYPWLKATKVASQMAHYFPM